MAFPCLRRRHLVLRLIVLDRGPVSKSQAVHRPFEFKTESMGDGLHEWFSKTHGKGWIDCKTKKPCGRAKTGPGAKRKYPACRPTLRVTRGRILCKATHAKFLHLLWLHIPVGTIAVSAILFCSAAASVRSTDGGRGTDRVIHGAKLVAGSGLNEGIPRRSAELCVSLAARSGIRAVAENWCGAPHRTS